MILKKIVVAYDNSELAQKALDSAMDMAKNVPEIKIEVLMVLDLPQSTIKTFDLSGFFRAMRDYYDEIAEEVKAKVKGAPNQIGVHIVEGKPSDKILEFAEEEDADLIVLGSVGKSGARQYLGSVSHAIIHKSPIPVLVVK